MLFPCSATNWANWVCAAAATLAVTLCDVICGWWKITWPSSAIDNRNPHWKRKAWLKMKFWDTFWKNLWKFWENFLNESTIFLKLAGIVGNFGEIMATFWEDFRWNFLGSSWNDLQNCSKFFWENHEETDSWRNCRRKKFYKIWEKTNEILREIMEDGFLKKL